LIKRTIPVLAGTLVLLAVLAASSPALHHAQAQSAEPINLLAVDTDPTGNTATSLGTIDDCAVIQSGQPVNVDIVVDSVPSAGVSGLGVDVMYDASVLRVTAINYNYMMTAGGGAIMFAFMDPLPDSDGDFRADIADLSQNFETGQGVLARVTFEAVDTGVSPIVLTDQISGDNLTDILDSNSAFYDISEVRAANISVGAACPTPADLRVTSATVSAPAQATAGVAASVTVDSTVTNAGPYEPVNADVTTTLTLPADCAAAGGPSQTTQDTSLALSTPANISHSFSVTCSQASFHSIGASVALVADDLVAIESNPVNNVRAADPATLPVLGVADLQPGAPVAQAPAVLFAGMQFTLQATVPVSNAGPFGPATARTSVLLTMPSDCAAYSPNPAVSEVPVAAGGSADANVFWKVVCNNYGAHTLSLSATTTPGDLHVTDPAGTNASSSSLPKDVFVGICGPDPQPDGDPIQNMGPELVTLAGQLSFLLADAQGDPPPPVPAQYSQQLDCSFQQTASDQAGTPGNDCPLGVGTTQPCSLKFKTSLDLVGGSPEATPTARLAPIGVTFIPADYNWANDTAVPNGSPNSSGQFSIRTDGALLPNGIPCILDVGFEVTPGYEGAIQANAPASNLNSDITNPNVWPNDMNAERAAVEKSFTQGGQVLATLWSRSIIPLDFSGAKLPLNILTWKLHPTYQAVTGAQWVVVPFPGDALSDDTPFTPGPDPDADDPNPGPIPTTTCAPHSVEMSFNGMAGNSMFINCLTPGSHMSWQLLDPDARSVTGDQGPRTEVATCGLDVDNDGLSQNAETYWGTSPTTVDSDGDGHADSPDNCRTTPNAGQEDLDSDRIGDICDPDDENDGIADASDNCPRAINPTQANQVHPVSPPGDHCEDPDADAVMDVSDNCPDAANPGQQNQVHPERPAGDHCDDPDNDGVADVADNCADTANASQANRVHPLSPAGDHCDDPDEDSVMDAGDNCPDTSNAGQENLDSDAFGDACESAQCLTVPNFWNTPSTDTDCDGFPDTAPASGRAAESFLGTDAADKCSNTPASDDEPTDVWPTDFNDDQRANLSDVVAFGPHFNKIAPDPAYSSRFDLSGDGRVMLADVVLYGPFFNKSCTP
jgi:hypothetical protein